MKKKYFLLEKFVYTDIENSDNKKPIRNFRLGCLYEGFLYQVAQNILKHKKDDNSSQVSYGFMGKSLLPNHNLAPARS